MGILEVVQNCVSRFMEMSADKQNWRQNTETSHAITKVTTPQPRRCRILMTFFFGCFYRSTVNLCLWKRHKASITHKTSHTKTAILPLFSSISLVNCDAENCSITRIPIIMTSIASHLLGPPHVPGSSFSSSFSPKRLTEVEYDIKR
jgi:hypothetical protein